MEAFLDLKLSGGRLSLVCALTTFFSTWRWKDPSVFLMQVSLVLCNLGSYRNAPLVPSFCHVYPYSLCRTLHSLYRLAGWNTSLGTVFCVYASCARYSVRTQSWAVVLLLTALLRLWLLLLLLM